ncbi:tRNA (adenosine(37)-N6)-threonylcarbamoyltransferase complex dimerization subunit type 1 TsaB [Leeuwenhoekiella sp. MAR_2009_132]|uniref:tRNA (adenosine(37)-N6)-threonylcarbamoyltransferase complex dimerization subunit type 1 TsaB n=1 Tax=Leeuwenhoekiella sp. MAR_2009_132 TaxID=1392489 RepID=UPI00048C805F|nr:tRNA (adenosine(37)-N6)-threonylcarbamoyltransferase complex dimerization subunit type 1 TsaB [Leeuwenhoekiella sp. MAR_2009_132]
MALILCIETTTTNCSVALANNGAVIALKEDMGLNYSHAERLHIYIQEVFEKAGVAQSALDAIAVSKGPGSYTGLRIGVSSAKGLSFALDIPLIATNTLKALAMQARVSDAKYIIPLLDARRMEVYSAIYDADFNELRGIEAQIIDEHSFNDFLNAGKTVFIGDGAEKLQRINKHPNGNFVLEALPSAREMALLADAKYKISDIEDVAYFEPFYLKDFQINKPKK